MDFNSLANNFSFVVYLVVWFSLTGKKMFICRTVDMKQSTGNHNPYQNVWPVELRAGEDRAQWTYECERLSFIFENYTKHSPILYRLQNFHKLTSQTVGLTAKNFTTQPNWTIEVIAYKILDLSQLAVHASYQMDCDCKVENRECSECR